MISKLLKKNEKGFTLMEMLIVVAIIAVLVAIAIPTFNSSLNKARVGVDQANIRAGYASVMLKSFDDGVTSGTKYVLLADGNVAVLGSTAPTDGYKTVGQNDDGNLTIANLKVGTDGKWGKDKYVVYTYTEDTTNGVKIEISLSDNGTT